MYILNLTYLIKIHPCETGNYLTVPISLSGLRMCEDFFAYCCIFQFTNNNKNKKLSLLFFLFPLPARKQKGILM